MSLAAVRTRGYAYALGAYTIWGLIPVYFKLVAAAPPLELLSHRVLWAFLLLVPIGWRRDGLSELARALRSREARRGLGVSTLLIALNWLIYIWAVFGGRIVEASLGYFLTPLVSVLLGVAVLKERVERPVVVALALAACGVLWLTLLAGRAPWIAVGLALSFGSYGLARKLVRSVGAVAGLTVETALLSPLASATCSGPASTGRSRFARDPSGSTSCWCSPARSPRSRCCCSRAPSPGCRCRASASCSTSRPACSSCWRCWSTASPSARGRRGPSA